MMFTTQKALINKNKNYLKSVLALAFVLICFVITVTVLQGDVFADVNLVKTVIRIAGLGLTLIPAILVFAGILDWATHARLMLSGMLCWFIAAPFLMKESPARQDAE